MYDYRQIPSSLLWWLMPGGGPGGPGFGPGGPGGGPGFGPGGPGGPGGGPGFGPGGPGGPGGGPGFGPGGPGGPGGGPGGQAGMPQTPPPNFTPQKPAGQGIGAFAVDPGAIRPCTFRFVYIWQRNGEQYWAFLTFVGPRSAAGFRWTGFWWRYFGVDLRQIDQFRCF